MTEVAFAVDVLDTIDRPWTPIDRGLVDTMAAYWSNFARSGDPNGEGLPHWLLYKSDEVMELGDHVGPTPMPDVRAMAWFRAYYAKHQGFPP